MVARLGFSVATYVEPDILIADEILSVGDFRFGEKCEKRINDLISKGTTVLIVSHSLDSIRRMCSRVILLKKGEMICVGDTEEICRLYEESEN
jgi:ABC-type polysaccharide/polyol phosphate transport system ATPase subunit